MNYVTEQLTTLLKAARKAKKLSQAALAAKINLPQSHISMIERGHTNLKLSSLIKIARALELDVMLVPRQKIPLVTALIQSKTENNLDITPAYVADKEEDEDA